MMKAFYHVLIFSLVLSVVQCSKSSDSPVAEPDCVATPTAEGCEALLDLGDTVDTDGDGVLDSLPDNCLSIINADQANVDGDDYGDLCDDDIDADQKNNDDDNCDDVANIDQVDQDNDGVGDVCDDDIDGDDVLETNPDNCPYTENADQANQDGDSMGDLCDDDIDGDGIETSATDNCPYVNSSDVTDSDGDGLGNVCETNSDGDDIIDDEDNCDGDDNADQADQDGDDIGDVCEDDVDGDDVLDVSDNCPTVSNANQSDADVDDYGDACDDDVDGDGTANTSDFDDDGDGLPDDEDLCPQHSDAWYYSVLQKNYAPGSGDCPSTKYIVVRELAGETLTLCVDESGIGYMSRETKVLEETLEMFDFLGIGPNYIHDYAYQKNADWNSLDITKAGNYNGHYPSCTENTSTYISEFCGAWQQNADGDSQGDACDANPTTASAVKSNSVSSGRSTGGTFPWR